MEINTETIISSLICIGYDKVDPILFTYTLGKITKNDSKQIFTFKDQEMSSNYIEYDGFVYKLKEGLTLDTDVSKVEGFQKPLRKVLNTNQQLVELLSKMDFTDVISEKMRTYGIRSIEDLDSNIFSTKEIDFISQIFSPKLPKRTQNHK